MGHDGKEKKRGMLSIFRLLHLLHWDAQWEPLPRREAQRQKRKVIVQNDLKMFKKGFA